MRWALNLLHHAGLADRVYGPTLTLEVLEQAAAEGLPVYLYGSTEPTLDRLVPALERMFPALKIAGVEASKFRGAPARARPAEIAERIRASGARIVLVGLGCPRQEVFTYAMRPLLDMPLLAVGAAFDYHAGLLKNPPAVDAEVRAGVAVAARPGAEPAVEALHPAEPDLPGPARRPEDRPVEGRRHRRRPPSRSTPSRSERWPRPDSRTRITTA